MYFFVIYVTKSLNGILNELIVVDIRYLCVHGQLCWIACNNIQADNTLANLFATVILRVPLLFILITYMCIATALLKIAQTLDRIKTFKTCSAQIMLVAIYYWPVLIAFTLHAKILPNVSMINVSCCCPSSSVEPTHLCFTYSGMSQRNIHKNKTITNWNEDIVLYCTSFVSWLLIKTNK